MPSFFIPQVPEEDWEAAYQEMAKWAGGRAEVAGQRLYSVSFNHNGEEWTATVGQQLSGTRAVTKGRGINMRTTNYPLHDNSTVLAIFDAGNTMRVVHDNVSRRWANPFMTGRPIALQRFES